MIRCHNLSDILSINDPLTVPCYLPKEGELLKRFCFDRNLGIFITNCGNLRVNWRGKKRRRNDSS